MPKNKPQFKPLNDFILIKSFSEKETKAIEQKKTSISLPEATEKKGKTVWGTVIAVGPANSSIEVGQIVIVSEYDSYEIRLDGEGFLIIKESFIFTSYDK